MKRKNQRHAEERFAGRAKLLLAFAFLVLTPLSWADTPFFSNRTVEAQRLCYELKLDSALLLLDGEMEREPDALAPVLIKHLALTLRAFVTERTSDRNQLYQWHELAQRRFALSSSRTPYRNFGLGEMNFQMALIKGTDGKFMDAAMHVNQCLKQLRSNQKKYPDFALDDKTLGLLNAYLSTIPENYRWAVRILGFQGDHDRGMEMLRQISENTSSKGQVGLYPLEATYLYAFALSHVSQDADRAWTVLQTRVTNQRTSLLSAFFHANIAFKIRRNNHVITTLSQRPTGADYTSFHLLEYMLGAAYLFDLDQKAVQHLNNYLNSFQGTNYKQASRMRLSWWYLTQGNKKKAEEYRALIQQHKGHSKSEEDLLAENYAEKTLPDVRLLKARLLFDGGQYQEALAQIRHNSYSDFRTTEQQTEYCYRKGRIYMELDRWDLATEFLEAAAALGKESSEYYAAYACLYLADHAMETGDHTLAERHYRAALRYPKNKEFTDTIEQKAKSGISRSTKS